jgi:hypothetical protein
MMAAPSGPVRLAHVWLPRPDWRRAGPGRRGELSSGEGSGVDREQGFRAAPRDPVAAARFARRIAGMSAGPAP